ncbi:MAG: hypothetical protein SOZ59_05120 [Candidatus Limivivens sp.]|nr:hypothetical protein [Candidatus Limivivens sp.]
MASFEPNIIIMRLQEKINHAKLRNYLILGPDFHANVTACSGHSSNDSRDEEMVYQNRILRDFALQSVLFKTTECMVQ